MIRRFYINMTQKGNLNYSCAKLIKEGIINFVKTDKKQVEIAEIDWGRLEELDNEEMREALEKGYFVHKRVYTLERVLGIDSSNPYKRINEAKEIKETDKEGYIQVDAKGIINETDKAYYVLDRWIAKSQTLLEEGRLYIKDWLFFKKFLYE